MKYLVDSLNLMAKSDIFHHFGVLTVRPWRKELERNEPTKRLPVQHALVKLPLLTRFLQVGAVI